MSFLQLSALARRVASSDPKSGDEQREIQERLTQVLDSIDRAQHPRACESIDGALFLLNYTVKMGEIGGPEVLSVIERLLNNAHELLVQDQSSAPKGPARHVVLKGGNADAADVVGDMLLGEIMLKKGMLLPDHVDQALQICRQSGVLFGEAIVRTGAATQAQVDEALKYQDSCRNLVQSISHTRPAASAGPVGGVTLKMSDDKPEDEAPLGLRLMSDVLFGEVLVRQGILSQEQLERALRSQRATGARLGEELVNLGYCSWTDVNYALDLQGQMKRNAS